MLHKFFAAEICGPDENTYPTSFQNVVLKNPAVLTPADDRTMSIVSNYQRSSSNAIKIPKAILIMELKDNINISKDQLKSAFGNEFTYEKILQMACLPNSIFTGRIWIHTSDDKYPLDAIKLPCVSSEHVSYEWSATLEI